jgi:hypothetical protein
VTFKVRVIPCLDVKDGRVVKGVEFLDLRDAGDPVELAVRYQDEGADEIVFLDITASHEKRETAAQLARRCAEVIGLEGSADMVARGQENAARNGIGNARFAAADLNAISAAGLRRLCGEVSAVVLDPPRDGARELVPHLRQLSARRLVYVSCNPATLARDAAQLVHEEGYCLVAAGVMDMFPHTAHVEAMEVFERDG